MSKRKKIKRLQEEVLELEKRLEENSKPVVSPKSEEPVKKNSKTAINVYFDSSFVNSLAGARDTRQRSQSKNEREEALLWDEEAHDREDNLREKDDIRTLERNDRERARARRIKRRKRAYRRERAARFWGGFFKVLWFLIKAVVVLALIAVLVMAVVWALVNFGVMTATANPFISFVWDLIARLFALFNMGVPAWVI